MGKIEHTIDSQSVIEDILQSTKKIGQYIRQSPCLLRKTKACPFYPDEKLSCGLCQIALSDQQNLISALVAAGYTLKDGPTKPSYTDLSLESALTINGIPINIEHYNGQFKSDIVNWD